MAPDHRQLARGEEVDSLQDDAPPHGRANESGTADDADDRESLLSHAEQIKIGGGDAVPQPRGRWKTMMFVAFLALALGGVTTMVFTKATQIPERDVLDFVDPLIGTGRGGHVFAGATLPFGMAKAVADVIGERQGGFASDNSKVSGFSHMHDSGTGGSPSLGNFPLFVHTSCPEDDISKCPFQKDERAIHYVPGSVHARAGYFDIELESGVRAEMTVSRKAVLYKFSFKNVTAESFQPVFASDADCLPNSPGPRSMYVDAASGRFTGKGNYEPSFGRGKYDAYFCADFQGAKLESVGTFNQSVHPGDAQVHSAYEKHPMPGVYARFAEVHPGDEILVRVGVSWLSMERACENAEAEIGDWSFDRVVNEAQDAWREKLSPIKISHRGVDDHSLRNYWSGVYRAFINPQDYSDENQLWNSTEPYYDSWYCIWDTFRGVHPFYILVDPESQSRMVRSLIDIYRHEGWMPDCRMSFCKGYTQGGSNADIVVVDSFIKNVPGVDWDAAYEALIKDAEEQPPNWDIEGRGGITSWKEVGYIPYRDNDHGGTTTRSVSRTVEYAYNDFAIALMANATNRAEDYTKYSSRAGNWLNLWDPSITSLNFTGFLQPRRKNGQFKFQDATLCSHLNNFNGCYWGAGGHETYEGSPWLYTFFAPGDMALLIKTLGGKESFIARLTTLHESGVLDMGDEQAFLTAFLYHYAGRPGLSAERAHRLVPRMFNDTRAGIPGNDDSGAMGAFVFFSMLGIFPNAGQPVYFIIPPFFEHISITNPMTGKVSTIRTVNFDGPEYKNIYIQSATLDGRPYTRNWLDHSFFAKGGTLELVLGDTESEWGTGEADVPPSLSTGLFLG